MEQNEAHCVPAEALVESLEGPSSTAISTSLDKVRSMKSAKEKANYRVCNTIVLRVVAPGAAMTLKSAKSNDDA